jgi:hypothetical protein
MSVVFERDKNMLIQLVEDCAIYGRTEQQRNNEAGMKVRAHIFFIAATDDSSSADEIAEVVLLAAQMEHKEKKTKYYGNLLANIAFSLLR